jgi:cytidylate kinase
MTKIIAFSGKKQSGKNTSANFIYAFFLVNSGLFKDIAISPRGTILATKHSDETAQEIDINKYYHNVGNIDTEIAGLISQLSSIIKLYSFADVLKRDICMNILGLTYEQCYGTDEEKNQLTELAYQGKQLTGRDIMQLVGTDFFRAVKPNVWPEVTLQRIVNEQTKIALITDCRFPNEVDAVKNHGGKVVRLTRQLASTDSQEEHISEKILDKNSYDWENFDYVIDNANMSIEEQCKAVYQMMEEEEGQA